MGCQCIAGNAEKATHVVEPDNLQENGTTEVFMRAPTIEVNKPEDEDFKIPIVKNRQQRKSISYMISVGDSDVILKDRRMSVNSLHFNITMNDKNIFTLGPQSVHRQLQEDSKRTNPNPSDMLITEKLISELNLLKRSPSFQDSPLSSIRSAPKSAEFNEKLLKEINQIRVSPKEYAKKLESMMRYIKKVATRNVYIFVYPGASKISLPSGSKSFNETIKMLKERAPIPELVLNDEIKINVDAKVFDQKNLKKIIAEKRHQLKTNYPNFTVNLDIITNATVSAVLQIIDDNPFQGQRRDAILNAKYKHFAVSQFSDKINRTFNLVCFA